MEVQDEPKTYLGELYFEKTVEMEMDIWEGRLSTDRDDPMSHFSAKYQTSVIYSHTAYWGISVGIALPA